MKKNTLILLIVLVILLAVAFFLMNQSGEKNVSGSDVRLFISIDSLSVDMIEIESPTGKVALQKRGVEWFLKEPVEYRADQSAVTSLIHQSKNLPVKAIVSSNPEKRGIFQVDTTGTLVKISQNGREVASFVVGKMGQSYDETYVRKEQSNDVAVVEGSISWSFKKAIKDWRDKAVLTIPKESIKGISYQYSGESFSLALRDSVWMIGSDKAKAGDVTSLLTSVANIQADDFIDSVLSPAPRITATVSVGDVQLRFSEIKDKDKYFVQTSNSPQWFELQGWRAKQILKHKKELL